MHNNHGRNVNADAGGPVFFTEAFKYLKLLFYLQLQLLQDYRQIMDLI